MDLLTRANSLFKQGQFTQCTSLCKDHLATHPRDLNAIRLFGNSAIALGLYNDAITIYQKLLALAPEDSGAHSALARQYYTLGDYPSALKHAKKASVLAPNLPTPWLVLGCIELEHGDEDEGLALFEKSRRSGMDQFLLDTLYTDHLLQLGRFNEAGETLRKLIKQRPDSALLYQKLAWSKKLTEGDPDIAVLRSLLDSTGSIRASVARSSESVVHANRALYKLEADIGNYGTSFDYLLKSKEPYLQQQPQERIPPKIDDYQGLRQIFTADFVRTRSALACQSNEPIFVVGMPRSGTTLLERILATNADIAPGGELVFVDAVQRELCNQYSGRPDNLRGVEKVPDDSWSNVGAEYVKRARTSVGAGRYFVDKLPGNFMYLGFIKSILPNARIIHISRHPMATCFSLFEQDFGHRHPYGNDLAVLGTAYMHYHRLMQYWQSILGDSIAHITYESMVSNPAATIRQLQDQLGLPLDVEAISKVQHSGIVRTASYWQVRQPVNTDSVERWQKFSQQLEPLAKALAPIL